MADLGGGDPELLSEDFPCAVPFGMRTDKADLIFSKFTVGMACPTQRPTGPHAICRILLRRGPAKVFIVETRWVMAGVCSFFSRRLNRRGAEERDSERRNLRDVPVILCRILRD